MGKMADTLDGRCRAVWLKLLSGRGGEPAEKFIASVASLTITLAYMDILNDIRPPYSSMLRFWYALGLPEVLGNRESISVIPQLPTR